MCGGGARGKKIEHLGIQGSRVGAQVSWKKVYLKFQNSSSHHSEFQKSDQQTRPATSLHTTPLAYTPTGKHPAQHTCVHRQTSQRQNALPTLPKLGHKKGTKSNLLIEKYSQINK